MVLNKGVYFAAITAFLWSFLAIALKISLSVLPPLTVTWFRFFLAFSFLLIYYIIADKKALSILKKPPKFAILAALCLGFNYTGYIAGINLTTPSIGQVFIQSGPILLAISGFVIFKEKVNNRQAIGLLIVLLGLSVFYHEQIINIAGGLRSYKLGVALVIFGGLAWSAYAVFQKIAVQNHHPMRLNLIIFGLPAFLLWPTVSYSSLPTLPIAQWLVLLFLGLNTLGAYGALAYALKYLDANKVSVIININPLITLGVMAWVSHIEVTWIAHEKFTFLTAIGAFAVIAGAMLTVIKGKKIDNVA